MIGPKIFNIYIDDISRQKNVETAVYADDRIYYTSSTDIDLMVLRLNDQLEPKKIGVIKIVSKLMLINQIQFFLHVVQKSHILLLNLTEYRFRGWIM